MGHGISLERRNHYIERHPEHAKHFGPQAVAHVQELGLLAQPETEESAQPTQLALGEAAMPVAHPEQPIE